MNREEIEQWLKRHSIKNYTINGDLSVDVNGDAYVGNLHATYLGMIPVKFYRVSGDFSTPTNVTSLKNCPDYVGGDFDCNACGLETLQYCPSTVGGGFDCNDCGLETLQYCPSTIGGDFNCSGNSLTTLSYSPHRVGGTFDCSWNSLKNLKYCPDIVGGDVICCGNPMRSMEHWDGLVGGDFYCNTTYNRWLPKGTIKGKLVIECDPDVSIEFGMWWIAKQADAYEQIKNPTKGMTSLHKMLWEV